VSFNAWLTQLQSLADAPPLATRVPLFLAEPHAQIGSIEPALAQHMYEVGLPLSASGGAWCIDGAADTALAELAHWLNVHGLGSSWRDELLAVCDTSNRVVGVIERAAVRPLGITTHAVHLVGRALGGEVWVQQRALDKTTDPGLWDTLMGGLVSAGEAIVDTLERETWEEAGLRVAALHDLAGMGRVTVRRPVRDGYMVEHIHMFAAMVPPQLTPVNQDGEVERFEAITPALLRQRLQANEFTLEAALILARWLAPASQGAA
jgi:8-oxo-dGTP pyrophosphatase MutT (NUDIX family)